MPWVRRRLPVPVVGAAKRRILLLLARRPLHGYAIASSAQVAVTGVYEHLKELRAEGLVAVTIKGRRKVYALTARGAKLVEVLRE